jgi:hypothetical protein
MGSAISYERFQVLLHFFIWYLLAVVSARELISHVVVCLYKTTNYFLETTHSCFIFMVLQANIYFIEHNVCKHCGSEKRHMVEPSEAPI